MSIFLKSVFALSLWQYPITDISVNKVGVVDRVRINAFCEGQIRPLLELDSVLTQAGKVQIAKIRDQHAELLKDLNQSLTNKTLSESEFFILQRNAETELLNSVQISEKKLVVQQQIILTNKLQTDSQLKSCFKAAIRQIGSQKGFKQIVIKDPGDLSPSVINNSAYEGTDITSDVIELMLQRGFCKDK